MGKFDSMRTENLGAMADGLEASAELKERAAQEMAQTARDMRSVAAIAKEMHGALVENTETMRDMSAAVEGAASRAEDASNEVFARVEERAVKTLRDVDRAAKLAMENSQRSAEEAASAIERARKATVAATVAVCAVACLACLIVLLVATGAMWLQFEAGASWLSGYGWLALPLSMAACAGLGAFVMAKVQERR